MKIDSSPICDILDGDYPEDMPMRDALAWHGIVSHFADVDMNDLDYQIRKTILDQCVMSRECLEGLYDELLMDMPFDIVGNYFMDLTYREDYPVSKATVEFESEED